MINNTTFLNLCKIESNSAEKAKKNEEKKKIEFA